MRRTEHLIQASDGRLLSVLTADLPDADHVFVLHGAPGVREMYGPHIEECASRGLRFLSYSRPGYQGSDRQPGRTVASCASDISAIADRIEAEKFYVIGESGGGPHALACAALLPDRVRAVALLAAVAPADARGLDWEEGLGEGNREEIGEVRKGADALGEYLEGEIRKLRTVRTEADLRVALDDFLCAADRAAIDGGFGAFLLAAWQRIAEDEIWGWLDDDLALFGDWGFELGDVVAPVAVWQGHDDLLVPFGHGRWLAERLPNAEFHPLPGVGHISLVASHFGAVLDALISPVP